MTPAQDLPDAEVRARLASGHVAVLGCGGLGSNVAVMLVRASVRRLTLVDFDVVAEDNLNRQHFFERHIGRPKTEALAEVLAEIGPTLDLRLHTETITAENLLAFVEGADVIVEAVDTAEAKALITDVCTRHLPDTPLVSVSGLAGYGHANTHLDDAGHRHLLRGGRPRERHPPGPLTPRLARHGRGGPPSAPGRPAAAGRRRRTSGRLQGRGPGLRHAGRAARRARRPAQAPPRDRRGRRDAPPSIATRLDLPHDLIEGVFCNHTVYGLDHVIRPGDRIAFVPYGTPGPHRFTLGLYDAGRGNRSDD